MTERTPQRLGDYRFVLGQNRRNALVARQVVAHTATLSAHLLAGLPMPRAADVLAAAETQLGLPYAISGCRCNPQPCWARDCSGLICFALNVNSYPSICTSSFGFAQLGRDHGTIIPKAQALWTPGAIGVRCPFCDPNFNGSNGHVWFCKGDGVHSIEEGGHATGCYEGLADKDGDVLFMLIPGVDYSLAPPPKPVPQEESVLIQAPHPPIPSTSIATASWSPANATDVLLEHGASISGDEPVGDPKAWKAGMPRVWRNRDGNGNPMALTGITPRVKLYPDPEAGQPTGTGIISRDVHGNTHIGNWSH